MVDEIAQKLSAHFSDGMAALGRELGVKLGKAKSADRFAFGMERINLRLSRSSAKAQEVLLSSLSKKIGVSVEQLTAWLQAYNADQQTG